MLDSGSQVWASGPWGLSFRVVSVGFSVQVLTVWTLGIRTWGFGSRVLGLRSRLSRLQSRWMGFELQLLLSH